MQNNVYIILHFSLLFISIYYYSRVDKALIKAAIIAMVVYNLCLLLKQYLGIKQELSLSALIAFVFSCILSVTHVYRSAEIRKTDKQLITLFFLPVLYAVISVVYRFFPLGLPLTLLSLSILIYYTFKYQKKDYLTQELAIMNLFGIQFVLTFVKGLYNFYG